jgi:hypothetical protein
MPSKISNSYDAIIVGCGIAGLDLLYHIPKNRKENISHEGISFERELPEEREHGNPSETGLDGG